MVDKNDVIAIVRILRRVTAIVKVYPFLYSMLYVSCMLVYMFCSDEASTLCDQLFLHFSIYDSVCDRTFLLIKTMQVASFGVYFTLIPNLYGICR